MNSIFINMKKFLITEEEKLDILSKYTDSNDKLLIYLRRNYPVNETPEKFRDFIGKYTILVDDKSIPLINNFGRIVNKIDLELSERFSDLDDKSRRQTIKKYLKLFEI